MPTGTQSTLTKLASDTWYSWQRKAYASNGRWEGKREGRIVSIYHHGTKMIEITGLPALRGIRHATVKAIDPGRRSTTDKQGINKILKGLDLTEVTYDTLFGTVDIADIESEADYGKPWTPPLRVEDTVGY